MTNGDKIKLRAELAGKAMQGMLSNSFWSNYDERETSESVMAEWAVLHADALMAELGINIDEEYLV